MRKAREANLDNDFTTACFHLEKELGVTLTPEYPAAKFIVQLEELGKYAKKQEKEMRRSKSSSTFR